MHDVSSTPAAYPYFANFIRNLTFRVPCILSTRVFLLIYFQQDATLRSLFIAGKLLCMFRVVLHPSSGAHNCFYSIWYLSNRYCYLPLLWNSWNWFEGGVGIVLICFDAVTVVRQQPHQNRPIHLIFVVPCIMLNSEIIPTRCNNCVYSSQWLYSTCFGWQFHPSSGV